MGSLQSKVEEYQERNHQVEEKNYILRREIGRLQLNANAYKENNKEIENLREQINEMAGQMDEIRLSYQEQSMMIIKRETDKNNRKYEQDLAVMKAHNEVIQNRLDLLEAK